MSTTRRQWLRGVLGSALLPSLSMSPICAALAQGHYPSRPVRWIVPYLPGTAPDIAARILAEAAATRLGQPIIVENRGGAAGNLGTRIAARAAADGYTLLYTASPTAANMHIYKDPGYDALKDFDHIMRFSTSDVCLVVHAESDIYTPQDLLARLRANPTQVEYASGGVGTPSHLGVELLLSETGTQALHVPYKGASEIVNAILGRQVIFGMPIFSVAWPLVKSGKLRALATAGSARNPVAREIATLAEQGIAGVVLISWGGLSVPAGTPGPIRQTIFQAFSQTLNQAEVIAKLQENGSAVNLGDTVTYTENLRQEMRLTETMMKKLGLQPI